MPNEMTSRLADLIAKAKRNKNNRAFACEQERNFFLAEQLIEKGVIVPPCKIGDTVYEAIFYNKGKFSHWNDSEVVGFHLGDYPKLRGTKRKQYIVVWHRFPNCICHIPLDSFGKTVFLEHQIEEAEKVLRGANNAE